MFNPADIVDTWREVQAAATAPRDDIPSTTYHFVDEARASATLPLDTSPLQTNATISYDSKFKSSFSAYDPEMMTDVADKFKQALDVLTFDIQREPPETQWIGNFKMAQQACANVAVSSNMKETCANASSGHLDISVRMMLQFL